jgi:NADPH-dependent 2,4-dienoyl-CoA reductase/sulfur reductase-like enzyme
MVDNWYRLGVMPGARSGRPAFPPIFKVETDNEFPVMRVAVVGSGPAGCAAAIALCRTVGRSY